MTDPKKEEELPKSEDENLPWEYYIDHSCPDKKKGCCVYHARCFFLVPDLEARRLHALDERVKKFDGIRERINMLILHVEGFTHNTWNPPTKFHLETLKLLREAMEDK